MKSTATASVRSPGSRTNAALSEQEEQNRNLARELHDVVCQKLAGFAMEIDALRLNPPPSSQELERRLQQLSSKVANLAHTMHEISRQLHPAVLEDLGLVEALRGECFAFSQLYGNPVTFLAEQVPKTLPPAVALHLFRIAQQSLSNAGQHARGAPVSVRLNGSHRTITLRIQDSGPGFSAPTARRRGLGLLNIKERARAIHATLRVYSRPGKGSRVIIRVPIPGNSRLLPRKNT